MIFRHISDALRELERYYPIRYPGGPRQHLLIEEAGHVKAVEIKSSRTFNSRRVSGLAK